MALSRIYLALMLALSMVLTTQTMALARGMTMPVDEMVLCIGTGSVTVLVDEDGQPVAPPQFCPDCSFGFSAVFDRPHGPIMRPLGSRVALRIDRGQLRRTSVAIPASARGPPVLF